MIEYHRIKEFKQARKCWLGVLPTPRLDCTCNLVPFS